MIKFLFIFIKSIEMDYIERWIILPKDIISWLVAEICQFVADIYQLGADICQLVSEELRKG